ncbi:MAG TPA: RlmE family RNA methyltransferase, partial [Desulfobacterales bacterium]|nr:RlmE family RNA methyltransferase [Desulfobacterales bacterium]
DQGYPARSVWKLQEMHERFRLLDAGPRVLDLGCSPGSWSLMVLELLAGRGSLTGVDLDEPDAKLIARPGFTFIRGDFTDPAVLAAVATRGPFDVVLSDAAPSTSGNRIRDTERSLELGRAVLAAASGCLRAGGNLALKIFQGGGERETLDALKAGFESARAFKPKASRPESMEIYFVALRRRAASTTLKP